VILCNRIQGQYSDRRICKIMTLNEIHYNLFCNRFSSFWKVFIRKTCSRLCIESAGRYSHHKQVKVVYCYIDKESWGLQSQRHLHVCHIVKLSDCHWSQYSCLVNMRSFHQVRSEKVARDHARPWSHLCFPVVAGKNTCDLHFCFCLRSTFDVSSYNRRCERSCYVLHAL
jgi:hypothetical protein